MKRRSRVIADRQADPLRILFVESSKANIEFTLERCERSCTIKRLSSLEQATPFLRTSLFHVLLVNDSSDHRLDWDELQELQREFPAVEFVVLTDREDVAD